MRILFIHGRAQGGNSPDNLKKIWIATLEQGLNASGKALPDNIAIDFPFYGDKLDELTELAKMGDPEDLIAKGGGQDTEYQEFIQSALNEIKERKEISDDIVAAEEGNQDIEEKGIQNWEWVHAIARFLDQKFLKVSEFTIEKFLTDVYLYLNIPHVTTSINRIVERELTDEPTVIVGHSLGSIVAYKIIESNNINLRKFVTVGSPLGISAISSKLGVAYNIAGNAGWYNAYDEGDIVALNPLVKPYFPTDPEIENYEPIPLIMSGCYNEFFRC